MSRVLLLIITEMVVYKSYLVRRNKLHNACPLLFHSREMIIRFGFDMGEEGVKGEIKVRVKSFGGSPALASLCLSLKLAAGVSCGAFFCAIAIASGVSIFFYNPSNRAVLTSVCAA